MTILLFVAIGLAITAAVIAYSSMWIRNARLKGLYPKPGQVTMQHVESLISTGNKILAIRAYRDVHGVSLKQAKAAVEKISAA